MNEAHMELQINPIAKAFELLGGPSGVSRRLAEQGIRLTPWACNKWLRAGRLPRTDYTGETAYAQAIERALAGAVSAAAMLEHGRQSLAGRAA
jgi:hypothetical protein